MNFTGERELIVIWGMRGRRFEKHLGDAWRETGRLFQKEKAWVNLCIVTEMGSSR